MRITSHFIGMALDGSCFGDLFVDMQRYAKKHNLEDAVEFQNVLSLHITLYYLEASITSEEKLHILQSITAVSAGKVISIPPLHGGYFGPPGNERVCYLGFTQSQTLEEIHRFFAKTYRRTQIAENQLAFVPHISLFRIHNPTAYAPHKAAMDALIHKHVQLLDRASLVLAPNIRLYRVNSLFRPEIQIPYGGL